MNVEKKQYMCTLKCNIELVNNKIKTCANYNYLRTNFNKQSLNGDKENKRKI